MTRIPVALLALAFAALLSACASGPVRRVSEPTAAIQQLTVQADGSWSVALRLENFSSVPMRFEDVALAIRLDGVGAGTLGGNAGITIGPESADVATFAFTLPRTRACASPTRSLRAAACPMPSKAGSAPHPRTEGCATSTSSARAH